MSESPSMKSKKMIPSEDSVSPSAPPPPVVPMVPIGVPGQPITTNFLNAAVAPSSRKRVETSQPLKYTSEETDTHLIVPKKVTPSSPPKSILKESATNSNNKHKSRSKKVPVAPVAEEKKESEEDKFVPDPEPVTEFSKVLDVWTKNNRCLYILCVEIPNLEKMNVKPNYVSKLDAARLESGSEITMQDQKANVVYTFHTVYEKMVRNYLSSPEGGKMDPKKITPEIMAKYNVGDVMERIFMSFTDADGIEHKIPVSTLRSWWSQHQAVISEYQEEQERKKTMWIDQQEERKKLLAFAEEQRRKDRKRKVDGINFFYKNQDLFTPEVLEFIQDPESQKKLRLMQDYVETKKHDPILDYKLENLERFSQMGPMDRLAYNVLAAALTTNEQYMQKTQEEDSTMKDD